MKILLITYTFLPDATPRSMRWSQLKNHWQKEGHEVHVITASSSDLNDISQEQNIVRVKENYIGKMRKKIILKGNTNSDENIAADKRFKFLGYIFKSILSKIYKFSLKSFQWPDYAWTWILSSRKEIKAYVDKSGPFDMMISVSHPFSSHLVAYFIKKDLPHLRWIVDIGDPFCFLDEAQPNNFKIYESLNKKVEGKIMDTCESISVTTDETKQEYSRIFPNLRDKINVIPPLVDEKSFELIDISKQSKNKLSDSIKLVYTGTLYSKIRNPFYFLDILEEVAKLSKREIEMHFFGLTNDLNISSLPSFSFKLNFHGEVSKEKINTEILSANILVNLGNSTYYQLPSKLVDYSSYGKPILNISSIENDSSSSFLEDYSNSLNVNTKKELQKKDYEIICSFIENENVLSINQVIDFLEDYRLEAISDSYKNLFN